ncbi:hydroxyphenylacetyl-CoA thioesterase PaaI [Arthrobacter tumbae]|uniref:hydroxyphenylacetyl-CoA thioesterase PaaI n=1 Tax=Arthrobacter tumbae TaxID=163874 RepID=UPI0019594170|nr:hydroxyphenylacetyl-CoA thioesterase PaaI [Arthrobacter tumbae]MBM7780582.1 acyl-CoA thioesterase [Arthrobacter tumbae]
MKDTDVRPAHPILEQDHASHWLGIEVLRLADGHATITMRLREEMLNGFGIAHGGMVFAFADSAFALACNPPGETETITVASGVDINFLAPAFPGDLLTAVADRKASAGRSGLYDISITAANDDGDTRLIAEFRGRSRTVPNKAGRDAPSTNQPETRTS